MGGGQGVQFLLSMFCRLFANGCGSLCRNGGAWHTLGVGGVSDPYIALCLAEIELHGLLAFRLLQYCDRFHEVSKAMQCRVNKPTLRLMCLLVVAS